MSNLAFLLTLFPTFSLNEPHTLSLEELESLLEQNLSKGDLEAATQLWMLGDVANVRSFLKNEPMNHKGTIDCEKLASMIISGEKLPPWLTRFFHDVPEDQRIQQSFLLSAYCLKYAFKKADHKAVRGLFLFDYITRSVLEYVRCRDLNLPHTTDIEWISSPETDWPEEFQNLLSIWNTHKKEPLALEHHLAEWRFNYLEAKRENSPHFSLSRLIFSLALFQFIESRRPLLDETKRILQERIIRTLVQ